MVTGETKEAPFYPKFCLCLSVHPWDVVLCSFQWRSFTWVEYHKLRSCYLPGILTEICFCFWGKCLQDPWIFSMRVCLCVCVDFWHSCAEKSCLYWNTEAFCKNLTNTTMQQNPTLNYCYLQVNNRIRFSPTILWLLQSHFMLKWYFMVHMCGKILFSLSEQTRVQNLWG